MGIATWLPNTASIFKVIKSEVFRFPRLQSLHLFFPCRRFRPHTRGERGVRMRVVNCRGS